MASIAAIACNGVARLSTTGLRRVTSASAGVVNRRRGRSGQGRGHHCADARTICRSSLISAGRRSSMPAVAACALNGVSPTCRFICTSVGPSAQFAMVSRTRAPPVTPRSANTRPTARANRSAWDALARPPENTATSGNSRACDGSGAHTTRRLRFGSTCSAFDCGPIVANAQSLSGRHGRGQGRKSHAKCGLCHHPENSASPRPNGGISCGSTRCRTCAQ